MLPKTNRRNFIKTASLAAVPAVMPMPKQFSFTEVEKFLQSSDTKFYAVSNEWHVLNRIAFGPRPGDMEALKEKGTKAYIEEQLNPDEEKDTELNKRLKKATLDIKYNTTAGAMMGQGNEVNEKRPLSFLNKSLMECWATFPERKEKGWHEWIRPSMEVMAATWLRATYSKWQLKEVMTEFWHNHFNVSVDASMEMGTFIPHYDRDVIRKNCFGNFRTFLEDVAKSPAMLYYLNNKASKASPANENYARELFELHTLGEEHYFNDLYNKWRDVPGAMEGKPEGYIDEDVYEAARAFTGWTVADGSPNWRGGRKELLPNTGEFFYMESWHDNYQKRILGHEIPSNQPPLSDGLKVLDLVAYHPGTAKFVCKKIIKRLVDDEPPKALVDKAVATWIKAQKDDDQIKQVLRTILLSEEFATAKRTKVKKPMELVASFLRATNAEITPNMMLYWIMCGMGYTMFRWPAPTGHPEEGYYWSGPGMMLQKWKVLHTFLSWKEFGAAEFDFKKETAGKTTKEVVQFWSNRLLGGYASSEAISKVEHYLGNGDPTKPFDGNEWKLKMGIGLLAMSPEFQAR